MSQRCSPTSARAPVSCCRASRPLCDDVHSPSACDLRGADAGLAMSCFIEYAGSKLFGLVCPAGVGGPLGPCHRCFSCGRHDDIPSHDNDLREPLIRFHRAAASTLRTPQSREQRYGPADLNSCISAPRWGLFDRATRRAMRRPHPPPHRGQSDAVKCCIPGKAETGITSHIRRRSSAALNGFARNGIPETPPERSTSGCPDISITFNSR